jgi:FlaA1/EpsC-like NDP-sugar epimerase
LLVIRDLNINLFNHVFFYHLAVRLRPHPNGPQCSLSNHLTRPELSQAGKTVLITGDHTGIGYAIAQALAQASAERVIIIGRRDTLVASAASRLSSEFPSTQTLGRCCDIVDVVSVDRL